MTNDLVSMCFRCRKIKIGNMWVGEEHSSYELLSKRPNIKDGDCLECTEYFRKKDKNIRQEYVALRN